MNCNICRVHISYNHSHLKCGICDNIHHVKCVKLRNNEYRKMSYDDRNNWMCSKCVTLFPFYTCDDDSINALMNNISGKSIFSSRKHNAMLFDPFEIQAEELSSRISDEYDPDINYYAQNLKDID